MRTRGTGSVYRQKRSPYWWIKYYDDGVLHRESTRSTDPRVAEKRLRNRLEKIDRGELIRPRAGRLTLGDLIKRVAEHYALSECKSRPPVTQLLRFFGSQTRVRDITLERMTEYALRRRSERAAAQTIKNELAILGLGFNLACEAGVLPQRPPLPKIKVHNARRGFFTDAEVGAVLQHLPEYQRPFIEAAYITGWRRGELLALQWPQVDWESGTIRLERGTTKSGEPRTFPFAAHPRLAALIREQREKAAAVERRTGRLCPWVFNRDGHQLRGWYYDSWRSACRKAGVPGRLVHDLRRSAVRNLVRAGVSEQVAMSLSGHKTRSVFDRYNITSVADQREAVQKLAAARAAGSAAPANATSFEIGPTQTGIPTGILGGRSREAPVQSIAAQSGSRSEVWRPQRDSNPRAEITRLAVS
jgi:integrase